MSHVGERNDVAEYLASRKWLSQKTTLQELLTANGLPWGDADGTVFAKNYYCASILQPYGLQMPKSEVQGWWDWDHSRSHSIS